MKAKLVRISARGWRMLRQMAFDDEVPMGALTDRLIEDEWKRRVGQMDYAKMQTLSVQPAQASHEPPYDLPDEY